MRPALRGVGNLSLSACGAVLVTLPGAHYRIDQVHCDHWPAPLAHVGLWLLYLLGVALLSLGWLGMVSMLSREERAGAPRISLGTVLGMGVLPHAIALFAPLFLSEDPLCYAAIGRAIAKFHADPHLPLREGMPPGDPFLQILEPAWQRQPSAYSSGFHEIARLVARIGGDDLGRQLRLYQLIGLLSMLAVACLSALAARRARDQTDPSLGFERTLSPRAEGVRAAALVLFCPLAIIEGTLSAHNDGLLAVTVALAALFVVQGHRGLNHRS